MEKEIRKLFIIDEESRYFFSPYITYRKGHYPKYKNKDDEPKYRQRFVSDNIRWMTKCTLYKVNL